MTPAQKEQMRALTKEQKELIQSLLGKDVYLEMAKESGEENWTERMFGAVPAEHREKVEEIQERFNEAQSEIYQKTEGVIDQYTQAESEYPKHDAWPPSTRRLRDILARPHTDIV